MMSINLSFLTCKKIILFAKSILQPWNLEYCSFRNITDRQKNLSLLTVNVFSRYYINTIILTFSLQFKRENYPLNLHLEESARQRERERGFRRKSSPSTKNPKKFTASVGNPRITGVSPSCCSNFSNHIQIISIIDRSVVFSSKLIISN